MSYIVEDYFAYPDKAIRTYHISFSFLPAVFFSAFENFPGMSKGIIAENNDYFEYMENSMICNYDYLHGDIL